MAEKKEKQIGTVSNYFEHVKAAAIKLTAPLKVGDTLHITGGENDFEQPVKSMQINREDVEKAKKGEEVGIIVKEKVRKGSGDYRIKAYFKARLACLCGPQTCTESFKRAGRRCAFNISRCFNRRPGT